MTVSGTGGGAGISTINYGVSVLSGGGITAGGNGSVNVVGKGGNLTGTGRNNFGVFVNAGSSGLSPSHSSATV